MKLTRRRMMLISAAALAGGGVRAHPVNRHHFRALGADCAITLPGDPDRAAAAVAQVRQLVGRYEDTLSLWEPDSAVSRLNRDGILQDAPDELLDALAQATRIAHLSDGAFDITVQERWAALAAGRTPVPAERGMHSIEVRRRQVRLLRSGMAVTFNGIAQGIVTDRAVALLQSLGYRDLLANLGEFRGVGVRPDGGKWRLGVGRPGGSDIIAELELDDPAKSVATSEPRATLMAGQPHIFDPLDREGPRWASVTVRARDAAEADGVSTAIAASPIGAEMSILPGSTAVEAILVDKNGDVSAWRRDG